MNIINLEEVKEQKECMERANQLREILRNADLSWMDNPPDFRNPPELTEEEKDIDRKRYAEELKEYREKKQEFYHSRARYEQGIDNEQPLPHPLPPIPLLEDTQPLNLSDEELEERMLEISQWFEEIDSSTDTDEHENV